MYGEGDLAAGWSGIVEQDWRARPIANAARVPHWICCCCLVDATQMIQNQMLAQAFGRRRCWVAGMMSCLAWPMLEAEVPRRYLHQKSRSGHCHCRPCG